MLGVPMKDDQCVIVRLQDVKESATWEATHEINKGRTWESLQTQICIPKPSPLLLTLCYV